MPTVYKVLGQSQPSAATLTTAYTVPASSSAVVADIVACNIGSYPTTVRIAVRPAGAAIANQHYIAYDMSIAPQETIPLQLGITVAATDVISVYSFSGLVSFSVFGSEMSA